MPYPTSNQKKSKKAYEAKAHKHNIDANNSEAENSDNFFYDEVVENNNVASILIKIENNNDEGFAKKLLNAANTFYCKSDSNKSHKPCYLENSIRTKRRKRQQQYEAAKGMPILFTFWNQDKTVEKNIEAELFNNGWPNEVDKDDTGGLSEDEIETSNWHKRTKLHLKT
ncbi:14991_t:CDS:2, partial [Dentiscutata heterogama]